MKTANMFASAIESCMSSASPNLPTAGNVVPPLIGEHPSLIDFVVERHLIHTNSPVSTKLGDFRPHRRAKFLMLT